MADPNGHYLGALVFIYDKNNDLVARTAITGHNRKEKTITVSEGLDRIEPKTRLQLLILHPGGASEYKGILKDSVQGKYDILIYDEHLRDLRASVRRRLDASAVISDMMTDSDQQAAKEPLPVIIENMSTTGMLILPQDTRLEIGALLQIELNMGNKTGVLYCEVLREQEHPDGERRYGCKLFFFD